MYLTTVQQLLLTTIEKHEFNYFDEKKKITKNSHPNAYCHPRHSIDELPICGLCEMRKKKNTVHFDYIGFSCCKYLYYAIRFVFVSFEYCNTTMKKKQTNKIASEIKQIF